MYLCVLQQSDSMKKGDDLYRARKYWEAVDEYSSVIICWYTKFPKWSAANYLSLLPVTCIVQDFTKGLYVFHVFHCNIWRVLLRVSQWFIPRVMFEDIWHNYFTEVFYWDIPSVLLRYSKCFTEIFQVFYWHIPKCFTEISPSVLLRYPKCFTEIFQLFYWDIPSVLLRYPQVFYWDIPKCFTEISPSVLSLLSVLKFPEIFKMFTVQSQLSELELDGKMFG